MLDKQTEVSADAFDSIDSLYKALADQDEKRSRALLMLMLRHWLTESSHFDPVSGQAMPTGIIDFMEEISASVQHEPSDHQIQDRIYRIVSHTKESVLAILGHARDKILREHAMLPMHAVREMDSSSVQWLSRQPGRTLREKLAGKPYMKAVRRRSSVDTSENRVLKAFLLHLERILIDRQSVLGAAKEETCEELLVTLQRWFRSEDASEIGVWGNLPPNNTLLQDKRYRKIWDGWLWLQTIDEQILRDSKRVQRDILGVIYWNTLALLNSSGHFRTVQQPMMVDYDNFSIAPVLPVQGYLFPGTSTKMKGRVKSINYEKRFGFLTCKNDELFFHESNLSGTINIDALHAGDDVFFVMGKNYRGDCANDITLTEPVVPVNFDLSDNCLGIQVSETRYSLLMIADNLFLQKDQKTKQISTIESITALTEIPKALTTVITGSSVEFTDLKKERYHPVLVGSSVIDLCSIRPKFISDTGYQATPPFRLLQQRWSLDDNLELMVDCGTSKSIILRPDIETVSMRSLFSHRSTLSDATKSSASMFFTKRLSDYLKADHLTYLIPDWGNDFDLEGIRKSINFYFEESAPLPRSIAAIFAWQSSKRFVQDDLQDNDIVLVVDAFDDGIAITPVQAVYQTQLHERYDETRGISWERHPTVIVPDQSTHTTMVKNLNQEGCQTSEELILLFGFDGLASDAGAISFVKDNDWYHLPEATRAILNQNLSTDTLSHHIIKDCLISINKNFYNSNIFILPLEDIIKKSRFHNGYKWLGSAWSTIKGAQTLNEWQKRVDDILLWCDHLPELSIRIVRNGHFENFYLVKDATVTPQRGKTVDIPVEEFFTLPAGGQAHYSFPLLQGEGNKELHFVAYLKSPAFPLRENTSCKLKMTYTYGADDPYELKFIPIHPERAGFQSIRVEWRAATEDEMTNFENLAAPDFPDTKNWSDFKNFPREDGKAFSDLLDWVERDMRRIFDIENFFFNEDSKRIYNNNVIDSWDWKEDRKGNSFCYLKYDFGDIFFHESNFEVFDPNAEEISFDIEKQQNRDGYIARNITLGKTIPRRVVESLKRSLRFPVLTIWNHGHSLSEPNVPEHFRNIMFEGVQKAGSIIGSENISDALKEELFFFLCCLHRDAPSIVSTRLLEVVKDKTLLRKYYRNIAFAIGNAELPWQKDLLDRVITPIDNEGLTRSIAMEILSITLWRSKTLISTLTVEDLHMLIENLYGCLEVDLEKVNNFGKGHHIATLCKHLELILALLRSRGNEDETFKGVLAPNTDFAKKYVLLVDEVSKIMINKNLELRSRISLRISKPEIFHNTPDLLYALRMYLTGDSGANTIAITGVRDED